MPEIGVNAKPKAQPGTHTMTLVGVKSRVGQNKFAVKEDGSPDPEALREQFVWDFESDEQNEFGEQLNYSVWTNTSYGNEKAGLTKFLNMILAKEFKGLSKDERIAALRHKNTDELIGTQYQFILREQQGKNGTFVAHTDIEALFDENGKAKRILVEAPKAETPF